MSGNAIQMGVLTGLLGYHLRCAHVAVFQHFNRTLGTHDISPPQFGTLLLIEANPRVSQTSVAEALRFDRSTVVQIIDRLERPGPGPPRAVGPQDRRSNALVLTPCRGADAGRAQGAVRRARGNGRPAARRGGARNTDGPARTVAHARPGRGSALEAGQRIAREVVALAW